MKKFVSGIIVGLLLFAGASAFADSVGLIGQKVQGIFTVEKNGTKVADAVIINRSAYAPVRAVSDAAGVDLKVEGKKITIYDKEELTVIYTNGVSDQLKQSRIEGLTKGIAERKVEISELEALLEKERFKLESATTNGAKENANLNIQELEVKLKQMQDAIKESESQLAELQK